MGVPQRAVAGPGVQVSPVLISAEIKKNKQYLPPITVKNNGDETIIVRMKFAPLGHELSGAPTVPKRYKYRGDGLLRVKPNNFKLRPGQSRKVRVQVRVPPKRTGGAYAEMYVQGSPTTKSKGTVVVKTQVGVIFTLAMPGSRQKRMQSRAVFATQEKANGPVSLFAGLKNIGNTHSKVTGTVSVSKKGKVVGKAHVRSGNILPGFSRNYKATWRAKRKQLAPGTYQLTANLKADAMNYTLKGQMVVKRRGELVRHKAALRRFETPPVVKNKPIELKATVANQGNVAFSPVGRLTFRNSKGRKVGHTKLTSSRKIKPRKTGVLTGVLPKGLPPGNYRAELKLTSGKALVLAKFNTEQQVIARRIVVQASVAKLLPPSKDKPFVTLELKNESNVAVDSEGIIAVTDARGNVVGQVILDKRQVPIGKSTSYLLGLPEGLSSGVYELRARVNYGGKAPATKTLKHFVE